MKLRIPRDMFDNPQPPQIFLCNTGKKIIGELPAYESSLDGKWNAYSELTFSIDRQYTDVLTGETKVNQLFDKAEGLRKVYVKDIGYFVIQDPDAVYSDKDSKTITCFSSEYDTGTKYLENFRINTGEIDSKEVIYLETIYGEDYTIDQDNLYELAKSGNYDPYEGYYIKNYSDADSYIYEQEQIKNVDDYNSHFVGFNSGIPLYVKRYPNVQFYNKTRPKLSLLHLVFEKIPEWEIGDVDVTLWRKERKFDEDRIAVYDFLMNEVSDTFKCVVEWDTINNKVNFYEEAEDGINDDNTIQTRWDTDIFISKDNLANEIKINYSTDDIKTKLKVSGSDSLDIREVNLGKNYIMNLDYYHNLEWMEQDLFDAYKNYIDLCQEANTGFDVNGIPSTKFPMPYGDAIKGRMIAYNKWNDLMHAVPATNDVVLVGDEFTKLYCLYTRNKAYTDANVFDTTNPTKHVGYYIANVYKDANRTEKIDPDSLIDGDQFIIEKYLFEYEEDKWKSGDKATFKCLKYLDKDVLEQVLLEKLKVYRVNEDLKANVSDNVLLRLGTSDGNDATIRIYNAQTTGDTDDAKKSNPSYLIQVIITNKQSGLDDTKTYTLTQWLQGNLTAKNMELEGYTVKYIGTMGAYFVLAKDDTRKAVLQDYGVKLLQEKHDVYTTIFQAQTEAMYSQEKYQCTASDNPPEEPVAENSLWLETDVDPPALYKRTNAKTDADFNQRWQSASVDATSADLENYQRYIDNYEKLQAVQSVLLEKEREAQFLLDGYSIPNNLINTDLYTLDANGDLRNPNNITLSGTIEYMLEEYLGSDIQGYVSDNNVPLYTFTTSKYPYKEFTLYFKNKVPYMAYSQSQGVNQAIMNYIAKETDFESFFNADQWMRLSPFIREDEFNDGNFLLTGYESEEERVEIGEELVEAAAKELKTLSQPSLEFSMDMANILSIPEFRTLIDQFQLGNFVRVSVRDDYLKRARLLEIHLTFDDLSDFSADFGNLITTKSEIDKHAELLSQAVTAGKQVAQAAGEWQRAVDKSNKLEEAIATGLQNAALEVGRASGQSITWDKQGIRCRKLLDGSTDEYEDQQIAIINNKIVFTNDGWKTSKAALGEFTIDIDGSGQAKSMYGLLADAVVSGYIKGSVIEGGSLKIGGTGGTFIVNEDGSVQILASDGETNVYATKDSVDLMEKARQYHIELSYDNSTIFGKPNQSCTISCKVYQWDKDITSQIKSFTWLRNGQKYTTTTEPKLTVKNSDIDVNAQFACQVTFDT